MNWHMVDAFNYLLHLTCYQLKTFAIEKIQKNNFNLKLQFSTKIIVETHSCKWGKGGGVSPSVM